MPVEQHWRVTWIGPMKRNVRQLVARAEGAEIMLSTTDDAGRQMRWIFSQITPDAFHWRSVRSQDAGAKWELLQEMRVSRRPKG